MKRVPFIIVLLFTMAVAVALLESFHHHIWEPSYNGRTLQEWLDAEAYHDTSWWPGRAATSNAILAMGTNAIPFLIESLNRGPDKRSQIKERIAWGMRRLGFNSKAIRFYDPYGQERLLASIEALWYLRPLANEAVPAITNIYEHGNSAQRMGALLALANLQAQDCLPFLLQELKTNCGPERRSIFYAIGDIHPSAEIGVPVLLQGLKGTNLEERVACAIGLGPYGTEASQSITELNRLMGDINNGLISEPYSTDLRPYQADVRNALISVSGLKQKDEASDPFVR